MADRTMTEERAISKILWGESETAVRQFLKGQGFTAELIDETIRKAFRERAAVVRKRGIAQVIFGAIVFAVCGGILLFLYSKIYSDTNEVHVVSRRITVTFFSLGAGAFFGLTVIGHGLYKLSKGAGVAGHAFDY